GVDKTKFEAKSDTQGRKYYCLVPLYGSAANEVDLPRWPRIAQDEFETLQARIAQRFDYVAPKLLAQNVKGLLGFLLNLVLLPGIRNVPGLIRTRVLKFARLTILSDLVRRDQIQGWDLPAGLALADDDVRLILGELLDPKYDQRNVDGIMKAISAAAAGAPSSAEILAVLEALKGAS